ncbi:hypothetical protein CVU37_00165 [candidate division BRC1 bacterium HGW-BRC1-1]|jgi:hypothetical protein|nr:MAG: hypothetical protein CVU37_00165 [candidate division BRC1 bacterium HGW-BRC1-1]
MKLSGGWLAVFGTAFALSATPLMAQDNRGQDPRSEAASQRIEQIQQQRAQREQALRDRATQQRSRETQPQAQRSSPDPRQSDPRSNTPQAAVQKVDPGAAQAAKQRQDAIQAKASQDEQRQQDMKKRIEDMREQQQSRSNAERARLEEARKSRDDNRGQTDTKVERSNVTDRRQQAQENETQSADDVQSQRDKAQQIREGRLEQVRKQQEDKRTEQQARVEEARKRADEARADRDKPSIDSSSQKLADEKPSVEPVNSRDQRQQKIDELRKAQETKRNEQQARIEDARKSAEEAKQGRSPSEPGATPSDSAQPANDRQQKIDELRKAQEQKRADQQNKLDERKSQAETQRDEQKARVEELRKQRDNGGQQQAGEASDQNVRPKPGETPTSDKAAAAQQRLEKIRAEREVQRNDLEKRLEGRREAEVAKTREIRTKREDVVKQQDQRVEEIKKSREARVEEQKVSVDERTKAISALREGRRDDANLQRLRQTTDKQALKETVSGLRADGVSKEQIKRTYLESRRSGGDVSTALSSLQPDRRVAMVGANVPQAAKGFDLSLKTRELSRRDLSNRLGDVKVSPRVELTENQLDAFRKGRVPDGISGPRDSDRMGRPLRDELRYWGSNYDRDWHRDNKNWDNRWSRKDYWDRFDDRNDRDVFNISINIGGAFLPPVVNPGYYPNYGSFQWNYWDGRRYYDHSYATTAFLNIGHVRYGGFDGVSVSGRYYSYGYGWIDGCIDYGGARIWVPGFWAPYSVRECNNVPVWIEPVYETIWNGCCWETVQVDGGYFRDYGYTDCHDVTRYQWVPGHFQYSYVS